MRRRVWLGGCALMACSGLTGLAPGNALAAAAGGESDDGAPAEVLLPLFPLGVVAFPGELVLLHVFEPRYRQLIAECAENGITFGIVTTVPGGASSVGTEMTLDRILATDASGTVDVAVRGLRVFRLQSFEPVIEGKLYSGGRVLFGRNNPRIDAQIQAALVQLFNRLQYRSGFQQKLSEPYPENLSFLIGHDVGLTQAQELQLLSMPVENDRQTYLLQHLLRTQ